MNLSLEGALGVVLRPILFSIYFLSGLIPRNRRRWVFGSWSGKRFADNSAALFEYAAKRKEAGIEIIWISSNRDIVHSLRGRGFKAFHPWSIAGIRTCLTSGIYVYDGLTKDINHWLSRGARRVLLRHGVGIKKVERAIEQPGHRLYQLFHGTAIQKLFWGYLLPWHLVRPDMTIATSPDHAVQGQTYYDITAERVAITGFPRVDRLLTPGDAPEGSKEREVIETINALDNRPVYLYLPTFRDAQAAFEFPLEEMQAAAARLGVTILVKLHFVDRSKHRSFETGKNGNLVLIDAKIDPHLLFSAVDGLISDYSSVTFDFVLTGKPIVFFVPDLDDYLQHSRSFYYEFNDVTPGPKLRNVTELEAALRDVGNTGIGRWREKYESVLDRFHTFRDAGSSERTYREIMTRFVPAAADKNLTEVANTRLEKCEYR